MARKHARPAARKARKKLLSKMASAERPAHIRFLHPPRRVVREMDGLRSIEGLLAEAFFIGPGKF